MPQFIASGLKPREDGGSRPVDFIFSQETKEEAKRFVEDSNLFRDWDKKELHELVPVKL